MSEKVKEYWLENNNALFRKARVEHTCGTMVSGCGNTIKAGDKYFDTQELIDPPYGFLKYCMACAEMDLDKFIKQRPHNQGNSCNCIKCRG